jgi:hypothetical protein
VIFAGTGDTRNATSECRARAAPHLACPTRRANTHLTSQNPHINTFFTEGVSGFAVPSFHLVKRPSGIDSGPGKSAHLPRMSIGSLGIGCHHRCWAERKRSGKTGVGAWHRISRDSPNVGYLSRKIRAWRMNRYQYVSGTLLCGVVASPSTLMFDWFVASLASVRDLSGVLLP